MRNLIYKDFLLQRGGKSIIYLVVMPIVSAFAFSTNILNIILPYIAGSYLYIVYANALDDTYMTERIFIAMPVGRKKIVGAKYASMGLYLCGFLIIIGVLSVFIRLLIPGFEEMALLSWSIFVQFLAVGGLYYSIYFPLYFRVGYKNSRWANYIAMIASAGSFTLMLKLTSELSGETVSSLQAALSYLFTIPEGVVNVILPLISAGLLYLSFRVSVFLYEKREF
jgi:ABC-2 type transport system permease protein